MKEGFVNGRLVFIGALFYGVTAMIIVVAALVAPDLFGFDFVAPELIGNLWGVLVGLLSAAAIVGVSWILVMHTIVGRKLAVDLGASVGHLPLADAIVLSVMAGLVEEMAFRGTLWTFVERFAGQWPALALTSLLFGMAHGAFRKGLGLWGTFALVSGLISGGLRIWSGAILAPVVMHILVDAVNLPLIARYFSVSDAESSRFQ